MKILAIVLLLGLSLFLFGCTQQAAAPTATPSIQATANASAAATASAAAAKTYTVSITALGFDPQTLEINAGDTVNFVNNDVAPHRVASAVHPTHNEYPEPGGCVGSKFDACKDMAQGETFSFNFTHVGTWGYHDHLNPSTTGTIVVK